MSQSSPETLSGPSAASDGTVAPHAAVPRVICTAARDAPAPTWGYNYTPKLSVDMAVVHSWAPYEAVVAALRSLSLTSLKGVRSREEARQTVAELYNHAAPFRRDRRFPASEVYVCLDRPPFAWKMQGIQEPLILTEAAAQGTEEFINGCSSYIRGIGNALDELTRTRDDRRDVPVLYDRAVFESMFLLTWTEGNMSAFNV